MKDSDLEELIHSAALQGMSPEKILRLKQRLKKKKRGVEALNKLFKERPKDK